MESNFFRNRSAILVVPYVEIRKMANTRINFHHLQEFIKLRSNEQSDSISLSE